MMPKDIQLLQTLNARLFHDLAGSVGIIDNCVSLMDDTNPSISLKAKNLATEESGNLIKKIKFFRAIYGLAEGEEMMSAVQLQKLLKDFFSTGRPQLNLRFEEGIIYLNSLLAKASVCLAVIASEHVTSAGEVSVFYGSEKDNNFVKIISNGKDVKVREESFSVLQGAANAPVKLTNCREHYVNILCNKSGYRISAKKTDDSLEYNLLKA